MLSAAGLPGQMLAEGSPEAAAAAAAAVAAPAGAGADGAAEALARKRGAPGELGGAGAKRARGPGGRAWGARRRAHCCDGVPLCAPLGAAPVRLPPHPAQAGGSPLTVESCRPCCVPLVSWLMSMKASELCLIARSSIVEESALGTAAPPVHKLTVMLRLVCLRGLSRACVRGERERCGSRAGAPRIYLTPDLPHAARAAQPAGAFSVSQALPADVEQSGLAVPHRIVQVDLSHMDPNPRTTRFLLLATPHAPTHGARSACVHVRADHYRASLQHGQQARAGAARRCPSAACGHDMRCLSTSGGCHGRQHALFA